MGGALEGRGAIVRPKGLEYELVLLCVSHVNITSVSPQLLIPVPVLVAVSDWSMDPMLEQDVWRSASTTSGALWLTMAGRLLTLWWLADRLASLPSVSDRVTYRHV